MKLRTYWAPLPLDPPLQTKIIRPNTVTDPGFPRRGGQPQMEVISLVFGQFFPRKLHKNEKGWIKRGAN